MEAGIRISAFKGITYQMNCKYSDFELLIWIDIRKVQRREVRSALYFAIFDEFRKNGIEIPFPQRDIHIRSTME